MAEEVRPHSALVRAQMVATSGVYEVAFVEFRVNWNY